MFTARVDPKKRVIWVEVTLHGPLGHRDLRFILDTGTPMTTVNTSIVDDLGYSPRMGKEASRSIGMGGAERGYIMAVSRLEALGIAVGPFEVACTDFPIDLGVDGLVGLDLFDGHILSLDFIDGVLTVGP